MKTKILEWNGITVRVTEVTDKNLFVRACQTTTGKVLLPKNVEVVLAKMYKAEHSPIRTREFMIEMVNIPTFVSTHFVRHKVGVEHFVQSNRIDRGGKAGEEVNRLTPINHTMKANAQALISMARKRLCWNASPETRKVMQMIRDCMIEVDNALADAMVPDCEYRGGLCYELKCCGKTRHYLDKLMDNSCMANDGDVKLLERAYMLICGYCLYRTQKKYCKECDNHEIRIGLEKLLDRLHKGLKHNGNDQK